MYEKRISRGEKKRQKRNRSKQTNTRFVDIPKTRIPKNLERERYQQNESHCGGRARRSGEQAWKGKQGRGHQSRVLSIAFSQAECKKRLPLSSPRPPPPPALLFSLSASNLAMSRGKLRDYDSLYLLHCCVSFPEITFLLRN